MESAANSSYSLPVVVDFRDTTESSQAGVKRVEKELDLATIERAHESTMEQDFEKRGVEDGEDPCCLTFAALSTAIVADFLSRRPGTVQVEKHEHRGAMLAAILAIHRDSIRRSLRGMKRMGRSRNRMSLTAVRQESGRSGRCTACLG